MALHPPQGEALGTQNVLVEGGMFLDKDVLFQASQLSGSALSLVNFESSLDGGYHRILGYKPFDAAQLPHGASQVFGAFVNYFDSSVIAMQGGDTYRSTGSGWTKINGADNHAAMSTVQATFYAWATTRLTFVDGDANHYPVRIENGGSYTILTNAPKGQKFIQEFEGYLFMTAGDGNLTFCAPQADNDYNAIDGAGQINVGFPIVGLGVWRGALYIFGQSRISQLTGTSAADWQVTPLTDNIGMIAPYTLQEVNGDLLYLSADGVRTISGTARVFDRELGVVSRPVNPILLPMGVNNWCSTVIGTKSQYRLFQSTSSTNSTTAPGLIATLKLQSNGSTAWEWSQISGIKASCAHSGIFNNANIVVHGAWDGYVYQQENGTDFNGAAIQATYQTPYLVYDDPYQRKVLYKLCLNTKTAGAANLNLSIRYNYSDASISQPTDVGVSLAGGAAIWDSGITWDGGAFWDATPNVRACAHLIGSGLNSSFVFSSNGGPDYSIQAFSVEYGTAARR